MVASRLRMASVWRPGSRRAAKAPARWLKPEPQASRWGKSRWVTVSDTCYPSDPPEYGPAAVDVQFLGPLDETAPMLDAIRKHMHRSDTWVEYLVDHGDGLWTIACKPVVEKGAACDALNMARPSMAAPVESLVILADLVTPGQLIVMVHVLRADKRRDS